MTDSAGTTFTCTYSLAYDAATAKVYRWIKTFAMTVASSQSLQCICAAGQEARSAATQTPLDRRLLSKSPLRWPILILTLNSISTKQILWMVCLRPSLENAFQACWRVTTAKSPLVIVKHHITSFF